MILVADTHALLWFLLKSSRLSETARRALADPRATIILPAIVLAEIAFLHARGRVPLSLDAVLSQTEAADNCLVYPFDASVARRLPVTLEIHDAMIVATALLHQELTGEAVALVSRDEQITASGLIAVIW